MSGWLHKQLCNRARRWSAPGLGTLPRRVRRRCRYLPPSLSSSLPSFLFRILSRNGMNLGSCGTRRQPFGWSPAQKVNAVGVVVISSSSMTSRPVLQRNGIFSLRQKPSPWFINLPNLRPKRKPLPRVDLLTKVRQHSEG